MAKANANFLQRSFLLLVLLGVLAGQAFAQQHLHVSGDDVQACELCTHTDHTPNTTGLPSAPSAVHELTRCADADLVEPSCRYAYRAYLGRAPPRS